MYREKVAQSAVPEAVARQFTGVASHYHAMWREDTPYAHFFHSRRRLVMELLSGGAGNVLDVGCGTGEMAAALRRQFRRYYGIDVSDGMLAEARRHCYSEPRTQFYKAIAESLPFTDNMFDAVLCLGALEYMADLDAVFREMLRVLSPSGTLVFSMLNGRSPYRICNRLLSRCSNPYERYFSEQFAYRLLARHELQCVDCVYFDFNLLPSPLDWRHPRVVGALRMRLDCLRRTPLRWLGTAFIMKARRKR